MTGTIRVRPLAVCIAIPLLGGWISSRLSGDIRAIYESLNLPSFAPSGVWFSVIWPILYLLMGIACYLIWEQKDAGAARWQALTFYAVQLALNFLWSPLFFRFGMLKGAFWVLCALLVLAVVTTACFSLIDRRTFWMLLPYLCWLLFAAVLNRAIITLN